MWHWILTVGGITNVSGKFYAFWSGVAGELGWFAAIYTIWHRKNCHARWCWRNGKFQYGDHYVFCQKHHPVLPNKPPTADEIMQYHKDHA